MTEEPENPHTTVEFVLAAELPDLEQAVATGSRVDVLRALAALAAHELAGNRCTKCHMSYMKTGEISSLMLRLQKITEDIELEIAAASEDSETPTEDGKPKKRGLRDIKLDRSHLQVVGEANTPDSDLPQYGTKAAPRRQNGRKSRG